MRTVCEHGLGCDLRQSGAVSGGGSGAREAGEERGAHLVRVGDQRGDHLGARRGGGELRRGEVGLGGAGGNAAGVEAAEGLLEVLVREELHRPVRDLR